MQEREQELERAASEALAVSSAAEAEHAAEDERLGKLQQELEEMNKKVLYPAEPHKHNPDMS